MTALSCVQLVTQALAKADFPLAVISFDFPAIFRWPRTNR
jgi:hypothetical protein